MVPTFSILIGSAGRPTLRATLESISAQALIPGDQILVGFDGRHVSSQQFCDLTLEFADLSPAIDYYRYVGLADTTKVIPPPWSNASPANEIIYPGQPYSWLGVEQINYALRELPITGSHVLTVGDDDVFTPGFLARLRDVCMSDQSRPVFWRFLAPWRVVLWDRPRLKSCFISGCCIAAPRQYVGLHPTDIETTHDYRWMDAIVRAARAQGHAPVWWDELGVIARPEDGMTLPQLSGAMVAEEAEGD